MRTPASSGLVRLDSGMVRGCCVGGLIGLWLEAGSAMASRHATEAALDAALTAGKALCGTRELHGFIREETMGNIGRPFMSWFYLGIVWGNSGQTSVKRVTI